MDYYKNHTSITYIASEQALCEWCNEWRSAQLLAVDTEFIRTNTFYPKLALIQVAVDSLPDRQFIIDPLEIQDLTPFFALLKEEHPIKILHSGSEDLEIFFHLTGELPARVIDTQIAACLMGDPLQMGYSSLLSKHLSIEISKTETRTNWLMRPLTALQVDYAAIDVKYLIDLYAYQMSLIEPLNRVSWLEEECENFKNKIIKQRDIYYPVHKMGDLKGLSSHEKNKARALVLWREKIAREEDVPRRFVLSDDSLLKLSRRHSVKMQDLFSFELSSKVVKKYGDQIIGKLVEKNTFDWSAIDLPEENETILPSDLKPLACNIISAIAVDLGLDPVFLLPKRLLQLALHYFWDCYILRKEAVLLSHELQGWRKEVVVFPLFEALKHQFVIFQSVSAN